MLKEKWKTHYHGPCSREEELQAFYMSELSEEELSPGEESNEEEEDNDYYVDLTGLIMDLQAAERQEYGKSNLRSDDGFGEALKKHPAELQGLLRKHKVVFGPLMSPGSCKKLIQMDLEVTDEHKNSTLRSRPIPLNEEDEKETMRQIYECCDAKLMSRYEGKDFPKPIWASGRTRDPYFEILGAPRGIMVTPSGGFARCSTFGSRHGKA